MFVETFILKTLGTSILKAAIAKSGFSSLVATAGTAIDVYTAFDSLHTVNTARDLGIVGLKIGYGNLSDRAVMYLVNKIVEDRYEIERQENGLYIAGSKLVQAPLFLANYEEFQSLVPEGFQNVKVVHRSGSKVTHGLRGTHVRDHKPLEVRRDHRKS
jgi:hypothetical protein